MEEYLMKAESPAPRRDYVAPRIDRREPVDTPLIGLGSGLVAPSAAFHPHARRVYEPPAVELRTPVEEPLVLIAGSGSASAVFH
jgi:hypothetical protein